MSPCCVRTRQRFRPALCSPSHSHSAPSRVLGPALCIHLHVSPAPWPPGGAAWLHHHLIIQSFCLQVPPTFCPLLILHQGEHPREWLSLRAWCHLWAYETHPKGPSGCRPGGRTMLSETRGSTWNHREVGQPSTLPPQLSRGAEQAPTPATPSALRLLLSPSRTLDGLSGWTPATCAPWQPDLHATLSWSRQLVLPGARRPFLCVPQPLCGPRDEAPCQGRGCSSADTVSRGAWPPTGVWATGQGGDVVASPVLRTRQLPDLTAGQEEKAS